ncbi:hypothetical protein RRG08_049999 [Elysia crispata]|uniref:Uncharacterized protein n=1 Tax=Elysia crispata TaxID=231223 RepID=A0AAE1EC32_9GAST|nr:hypothetical protein RRG08_049999 [Elysia crispata]
MLLNSKIATGDVINVEMLSNVNLVNAHHTGHVDYCLFFTSRFTSSKHAFLHRLIVSFPTQQHVWKWRQTPGNRTLTFANVLSAARLNGPFVWLSAVERLWGRLATP